MRKPYCKRIFYVLSYCHKEVSKISKVNRIDCTTVSPSRELNVCWARPMRSNLFTSQSNHRPCGGVEKNALGFRAPGYWTTVVHILCRELRSAFGLWSNPFLNVTLGVCGEVEGVALFVLKWDGLCLVHGVHLCWPQTYFGVFSILFLSFFLSSI